MKNNKKKNVKKLKETFWITFQKWKQKKKQNKTKKSKPKQNNNKKTAIIVKIKKNAYFYAYDTVYLM